LLNAIAAASSGTLESAVFFGSRSSRVATTSASAYDFMLVCENTGSFFRHMHRTGLLRRSPRVIAMIDRILAPTQVRLVSGDSIAKASVISAKALLEAAGVNRKDQFLAGRLFQDVKVVWARNGEALEVVGRAVASARGVSLNWVSPDLPETFTVEQYVRQLFRTSFSFEIRPETRGRADALFEAQASRLVPHFQPILESLVNAGDLKRVPEGFALSTKAGFATRLRRRIFLEWSRIRATGRWPKHAITFDGWLDYIIRKAERHSGETIELTRLERAAPFIFLWPRALRFLWRQRKSRRTV
jgi:hypothetical protein